MYAMTYKEAVSKLESLMTKVCEDHCPLIITRYKKPSVVIMSLEDYKSWEEKVAQLDSPEKIRELAKAFDESARNLGKEIEL